MHSVDQPKNFEIICMNDEFEVIDSYNNKMTCRDACDSSGGL